MAAPLNSNVYQLGPVVAECSKRGLQLSPAKLRLGVSKLRARHGTSDQGELRWSDHDRDQYQEVVSISIGGCFPLFILPRHIPSSDPPSYPGYWLMARCVWTILILGPSCPKYHSQSHRILQGGPGNRPATVGTAGRGREAKFNNRNIKRQ